MTNFTKVVLFTDTDGKARFKEETLPMEAGNPQSQLSEIFAAEGYQLRYSPVGFRSQFHTTGKPQWVFILSGQMEIGLQDGSSRVCSTRVSISIRQTPCLKGPHSTPMCMATGVGKWAMCP